MLITAVPKTAVKVDGDPGPREHDVGTTTTTKSRMGTSFDEEPEPKGMKRRTQTPLCGAIPPRLNGEPSANLLVERLWSSWRGHLGIVAESHSAVAQSQRTKGTARRRMRIRSADPA
jgi:hypothetical protein